MKYAILLSAFAAMATGCHLRDRSRATDKVTFHDDLNYSQDGRKTAGLDLYTPKAPITGQLYPAVVFIHGGYWRNQTRSYYKAFTGLYQNFGLSLASRGIATAIIDYRLFPEAKLVDQLDDVAAALAYIKANAKQYSIDTNNIFIVGHSAGGHLALLEAWQRKNFNIRGVVALSPILDVAHMRKNKEVDFNRELTVPFFGAGSDDAVQSPATYAKIGIKPALILFGSQDYAYLIEQGHIYKDKFNQQNLTQIEFGEVAGADHSAMVLNVFTKNDIVSDKIAAFIQKIIHNSL